MWIEFFNVEQCCIVVEAGKNSTLIPQRPGKGAGTNPQSGEGIFVAY
jgi:hypothetical protein